MHKAIKSPYVINQVMSAKHCVLEKAITGCRVKVKNVIDLQAKKLQVIMTQKGNMLDKKNNKNGI